MNPCVNDYVDYEIIIIIIIMIIIVGINVIFIFHNFFSSLEWPKYFSLFSFSLIFTFWSAETAQSMTQQALFFSF